jgi:hypothetical protein
MAKDDILQLILHRRDNSVAVGAFFGCGCIFLPGQYENSMCCILRSTYSIVGILPTY